MLYQEFLKKKEIVFESHGLEVSENEINPLLFDFQKAIVKWACRKGKAAIFADTGLGKTFMQIEWSRLVNEKTGSTVLIVAPLAVSIQTKREALKLGVKINLCRKPEDVRDGINIINYEILERFNPDCFRAIVLDESSILKNYMGKTKQTIINSFKNTQFKLACTATPSPNDHMEILNHADFLDAMKSHEALAIWFINDTMNMGKYRLKNYAKRDFWRWVSSWAVSCSKPSDLGYNNNGFNLPPLNIADTVVPVDETVGREDGMLFRVPELSATSYHKEKRLSSEGRVRKCAEIVPGMKGQIMIWCEMNHEADLLKRMIPAAQEVRGNNTSEQKEKAAIDFVNGDIPILISKPSIFGFGLNFQNCHNVIFCGLSFSYESYYQAIRRFWRFGQKEQVNVHLVIGSNELEILSIIRKKEEKYIELKTEMNRDILEFQEIIGERKYRMDYEQKKEIGEGWELILGDAVEEIKNLPSDSIGFVIFSPPFSNLYVYSDSYRDMGNNKNDVNFFKHFGFMVTELLRVTKPGRLCAVHCKDLVDYKGRDGRAGIRDFPGDIIRSMEAGGWKYHSRVTIWKDPVIEMQRTKAHGLLYKQLRKDSTYSRQGLPDYLLLFRKWCDPEIEDPVNWKTKDNFILDEWQKWASPVWFDIRQTNVLNIRLARAAEDEKHICPLQLDVIERSIYMWSNPGDLVFSPFAGIGSEGYTALKCGRRFVGIELKEEYFNNAVDNLNRAVFENSNSGQLTLFGKCAHEERGTL